MNASYAQGWARKNGYAFQNASELDFRSGVIDLTGIREENFVRVSATEVWLRDLEARRLSVGKRFFLAAPQNLYQISYYEVTEMSDPSGGFVTVKCVTPSTDDALNRYEAENQVMMLDPGSIGSRAFAGLPAGTQIFLLGDSIEIAQDAFEGADVLFICPENSAGWQYAQDHHLAVLQP